MAHDIRPSTILKRSDAARRDKRPAPDELVPKHLPNAVAYADDSELADALTGEARTPEHFHAYVPSESIQGQAWRIRYQFHPPEPGAPNGYVTGVHDGHGCPAHDNGRYCWHLDCGLAAVVRDFGHLLPNGGRIGQRERPVKAVSAQAEPEPRVIPEQAVGFWD